MKLKVNPVVDAPSQPYTATIRRLAEILQRQPVAYNTAVLGLKTAGLIRRPGQLNRYFKETPPEKRCLSIGSGADAMDGWLSTDSVPARLATVYLDATKSWPMPTASFRYVACEHMIEHVPYEAGLHVLRETHRVLQPGGILRISTPNLDVIRRLPDSDDPDDKDYILWFNRTFGSASQRAEETSPVHALNLVMHEFGHTYLYDEDTLRGALAQVGFRDIVRCEPSLSEHAELVGVDRHADYIPDTVNRVESMILEATA